MKIRSIAGLSFSLLSFSALAAEDAALVMVTATRQQARVSELVADVSVIEREEIERAGQMPLAQFLGRQPGIEFTNNGSAGSQSDVLIRGANTNQTVVLIDGMRIGSATSGTVNWSRLPLSQIERIEILRGPASALYGSDAIGGVVQIFTQRGEGPPRVNAEIGYGSYNTLSGSAGVAGEKDGWRYSVNASATTSDGFNNISNPQSTSYNPDRDGYSTTSLATALSYAPAKGHELGANFLYSVGRHQYDTSTVSKLRDHALAQTVQSVNFYSRNALTSLWTSTVRLGTSFDDSTTLVNGIRSTSSPLFRTDQQQLVWQNDIKLPSAGTLMLAWESLRQGITSTTAYPIKGRKIQSLVAGWSVNPGDHRLQASVRRDSNSQFGGKTTGVVGYGYQLTTAWLVNASYGTAFRAPTFNQLYSPTIVGGFQFGNPNLLPETSRNREASVRYDDGRHRAGMTVYRNTVTNLIQNTFPASNSGFANLYGETFSYEGRVDVFEFKASLDNQRPVDELGRMLVRRARQHGALELGRTNDVWDWRVGVTASGARYTDSTNNDRKGGGYALANLSGSYNFERDWSLFGRIDNLFNKKYETALDFATPGANLFVGVRYAPK
jgi:vitamin B12 transporter